MNGPDDNEMHKALWRGRLSPAEQARLRAQAGANPEAQADLEAELALSQALDRLPAAPLSSNFTSRVLQAVAAEQARLNRARTQSGWRAVLSLRWGRRLAFVGVVLGVAVLVVQQRKAHELRREIALQFEPLTKLDSASRVEVLQNFDTIQHLNTGAAQADLELLSLLEAKDK
jgi:anti-sigma factor RsiW